MLQEAVPKMANDPLTGGILDLNIILNFGRQWPELKEFAYETRTLVLDTLYNVEHLGALVLGFIVGTLLTTVVFLALTRRKQLASTITPLLLGFMLASNVQAQPQEPHVDLVTLKYVDKNFGSKLDGAGMCVFNSFRGSLVSQYRNEFDDYARWLAERFQGGGYPSRLTEYTRAYTQAKGIQDFDSQYVQIVGEDTIAAMEEACTDGRSPAFTYSGDPSFYGGPVPHMCNLVHADAQWWGVVDNNRPDRIEWVRRETAIKRHRHYDAGWAVIYLGKPQLGRPVNELPEPPDRRPFDPSIENLSLRTKPVQHQSTGHTWRDQGNGIWYLYRGEVRVGEYHASDGRYYTYRFGGGLEPSNLEFQAPTAGSGSKPTGVFYGGFPELRRGQTLYSYGSLPLADRAGQHLVQDRVKRDKQRARVVINGSEELESRVRSILQRLKSDAFAYGREAMEVILAQGYGKGVTVLKAAKNGLLVDVGFFRDEPGEHQLRDALVRADPSYRPGGGLTEAVDGYLGVLVAILIGLVVFYVFTIHKEQK